MLDVLNILDVLGVNGAQRVYSSLKGVLTPFDSASYTPVYYIFCTHPFDVLFRLSADETMIINCNIPVYEHSQKYYIFKITEGGFDIDGHWHTFMYLYNSEYESNVGAIYTKDITEYLANIDKENPYIKLYTLDATIMELGGFSSSSLNRMCTVAVIEQTLGTYYYPGAIWFNDKSKQTATEMTRYVYEQYGVTVSDILYMTVAEALELYKTNPT